MVIGHLQVERIHGVAGGQEIAGDGDDRLNPALLRCNRYPAAPGPLLEPGGARARGEPGADLPALAEAVARLELAVGDGAQIVQGFERRVPTRRRRSGGRLADRGERRHRLLGPRGRTFLGHCIASAGGQ